MSHIKFELCIPAGKVENVKLHPGLHDLIIISEELSPAIKTCRYVVQVHKDSSFCNVVAITFFL